MGAREKRTAAISVRVTETTRKLADEISASQRWSLADYIEQLVEDDAKRREAAKHDTD